MENTQQEQSKAVNENVSEIPPQVESVESEKAEESQEKAADAADSLADIWMKAANTYWDAFKLRKTDKDELNNPLLPKFLTNGTATRSRNSWNTYVSMCKSISQSMIEPETINSFLKTSDDLPETLLKMQRTEMDRFFNWHSGMLSKSADFEKLTKIMCIKTFM
ncbi:hypothetical protein QUF70_10395 [Desulfobacterales bacterium HSG17]|nr:hypothetical protein [Desulfobacterales bacterium HSG17]